MPRPLAPTRRIDEHTHNMGAALCRDAKKADAERAAQQRLLSGLHASSFRHTELPADTLQDVCVAAIVDAVKQHAPMEDLHALPVDLIQRVCDALTSTGAKSEDARALCNVAPETTPARRKRRGSSSALVDLVAH